MFSNKKSGKSLILLLIVIAVMSVALFFVTKMFNVGQVDKAQEEAFKLSVYEYNIEINEYKAQLAQTSDCSDENINFYGANLVKVIPNIAEKDMSKFKVEHGKLIYIGNDENEEKWSKEVKL